jgi:hypothetical protein
MATLAPSASGTGLTNIVTAPTATVATPASVPGSPVSEEKPVVDLSGNRKGKFHNGWTEEQEDLMAKWADIAACYRWLHDRCEKQYSRANMRMTVPVIILTTLTGTASVGLGQLVGDDRENQKYAQFAIGGVSLIAGIMTTLGNFFRYAQLSESNRVASISWGKFQRQIAVELSLHPNDRIDSMDFLKICRAELDRMIEQSPPIPDDVIAQFEKEFKDLPNLHKPDICHGIEHTEPFKDKKSRMKQIASEITMMMYHKKKLMRDQILPDLDLRISRLIESKITDIRAEHPITIDVTEEKKEHPLRRAHTLFDPHSRRILVAAPATKKKDAPLLNKVLIIDQIDGKKT